MTYAPFRLKELAKYWGDQDGVNLGIVGDTDHATKGVSYHLGKDQLRAGAYSASRPRDVAGLTNAASAIDIGRLGGSWKALQDFSDWLARRCVANDPKTVDVVEVIYSPDGKRVLGFKDGIDFLIPNYGDASHLTHTHISFYRDSEFRDKTALFKPYFEVDDMPAIPYTFGDDAQDGTFKSDGKPGHMYLDLLTGVLHAYPEPFTKHAFGPVELVGRGITGPGDVRKVGYLVGESPAFVIVQDGSFTLPPADVKHPVEISVDGRVVYSGSI